MTDSISSLLSRPTLSPGLASQYGHGFDPVRSIDAVAQQQILGANHLQKRVQALSMFLPPPCFNVSLLNGHRHAAREGTLTRLARHPESCTRQGSLQPDWQGSRRRQSWPKAGREIADASTNQQIAWAALAAHLRAEESRRPGALFIDPYASALANEGMPAGQPVAGDQVEPASVGFHEVATRYIDDRVLEIVGDPSLEVRQVVLLTDGMDTRPYRLPWPPQTRLFDVSPGGVYDVAANKLKAMGVRAPRGSLLRHVSADLALGIDREDEEWGEKLQRMGYRGDLPSVWLIQGVEALNPEGLHGVLGNASSRAMGGTLFVGELPRGAIGAAPAGEGAAAGPSWEDHVAKTLDSVFAKNGFSLQLHSHAEVGVELGRWVAKDAPPGSSIAAHGKVIFTATQRRLSDAQVEKARFEFARAEESGDEMGFEDML